MNQSCFLSNFSRLIIDPNRPENSSELILLSSDNIKIPGNLNIGEEEKNRVKNFHQKYHKNLEKFIKAKKKYNEIFLFQSIPSQIKLEELKEVLKYSME